MSGVNTSTEWGTPAPPPPEPLSQAAPGSYLYTALTRPRRRTAPASSHAPVPRWTLSPPQVTGPSIDWTIKPAPGKMASVAIYAALASQYSNTLGKAAAEKGLEWYDEYVQEAKDLPGSHPNIDLLLEILDKGVEAQITVAK